MDKAAELSYRSASVMPVKLLQRLDKVFVNGQLVPYHLQLNPTNKCNANCSWCSCRDVDRDVEMPYGEICEVLKYYNKRGSKAITISGGGEPTCHPQIMNILRQSHGLNYKVALVTNGINWGKDTEEGLEANEYLTWCRISITPMNVDYRSIVHNIARKWPKVIIGLTITIANERSIVDAQVACELANDMQNVTHVRCLDNILSPDDVLMDKAEYACSAITDKLIIQRRSKWRKGVNPCYVSKIRTNIDATGYIYPCCGTQYATDTKYVRPESMRMGHWSEYKNLSAFDGSICKKCYYGHYHDVLNALMTPVIHKDFV